LEHIQYSRKSQGVDDSLARDIAMRWEANASVYRASEYPQSVGQLRDPERIRTGLGAMIEKECEGLRGDPEREARAWLEKLAEADRRRDGYIDLAAEGIIERDELRARLAQSSK
jgi:hypothetical protein